MSHSLPEEVSEVLHDVLEGLSEEETIAHSRHKRLEHLALLLRNIAVAIAAVLFLLSLLLHSHTHLLKAAAYFCGAAAYCMEFILLTDCFTAKVPHQEMFMAYCFGPLYLLLGLSYLLGH